MTQPQTLNVEYEELMARADEIEQPLPSIPSTNPAGPCNLSFVNNAAAQLAISADSLRLYLKACEREWKALANSLRNAAKAYEEVDEGAADAINEDSSAATVTPGSTGGNDDLEEPSALPTPSSSPSSIEDPYYDVKQAAADIEAGDQGTAFSVFAQEWDAFQRKFQQETYRFRPFTYWEGASRVLVEQNFEQQRQWIYSMAQSCITLLNQATAVVDAHKIARPNSNWASTDSEHPTSYEVAQCEYWYAKNAKENPQALSRTIEWYDRLQQQSETSLSNYIKNASLPLSAANPQTPPSATVIDLPSSSDYEGAGSNSPYDWTATDDSLAGTPTNPASGLPTGLGTGPGTDPATDEMTPTDAWTGTPGLSTGSGIKPASFSGGGMPSMPLQAAMEAGSAAPAATARTAGGLGAMAPAGALGGRGGMGMAPMAPGAGQNQGQNGKAKRFSQDDQAFYTEKRAWTSSVIGNRRRNDAPDTDSTN